MKNGKKVNFQPNKFQKGVASPSVEEIVENLAKMRYIKEAAEGGGKGGDAQQGSK